MTFRPTSWWWWWLTITTVHSHVYVDKLIPLRTQVKRLDSDTIQLQLLIHYRPFLVTMMALPDAIGTSVLELSGGGWKEREQGQQPPTVYVNEYQGADWAAIGTFQNDTFEGMFRVGSNSFYVQSASRYNLSGDVNADFNSVGYWSLDVRNCSTDATGKQCAVSARNATLRRPQTDWWFGAPELERALREIITAAAASPREETDAATTRALQEPRTLPASGTDGDAAATLVTDNGTDTTSSNVSVSTVAWQDSNANRTRVENEAGQNVSPEVRPGTARRDGESSSIVSETNHFRFSNDSDSEIAGSLEPEFHEEVKRENISRLYTDNRQMSGDGSQHELRANTTIENGSDGPPIGRKERATEPTVFVDDEQPVRRQCCKCCNILRQYQKPFNFQAPCLYPTMGPYPMPPSRHFTRMPCHVGQNRMPGAYVQWQPTAHNHPCQLKKPGTVRPICPSEMQFFTECPCALFRHLGPYEGRHVGCCQPDASRTTTWSPCQNARYPCFRCRRPLPPTRRPCPSPVPFDPNPPDGVCQYKTCPPPAIVLTYPPELATYDSLSTYPPITTIGPPPCTYCGAQCPPHMHVVDWRDQGGTPAPPQLYQDLCVDDRRRSAAAPTPGASPCRQSHRPLSIQEPRRPVRPPAAPADHVPKPACQSRTGRPPSAAGFVYTPFRAPSSRAIRPFTAINAWSSHCEHRQTVPAQLAPGMRDKDASNVGESVVPNSRVVAHHLSNECNQKCSVTPQRRQRPFVRHTVAAHAARRRRDARNFASAATMWPPSEVNNDLANKENYSPAYRPQEHQAVTRAPSLPIDDQHRNHFSPRPTWGAVVTPAPHRGNFDHDLASTAVPYPRFDLQHRNNELDNSGRSGRQHNFNPGASAWNGHGWNEPGWNEPAWNGPDWNRPRIQGNDFWQPQGEAKFSCVQFQTPMIPYNVPMHRPMCSCNICSMMPGFNSASSIWIKSPPILMASLLVAALTFI